MKVCMHYMCVYIHVHVQSCLCGIQVHVCAWWCMGNSVKCVCGDRSACTCCMRRCRVNASALRVCVCVCEYMCVGYKCYVLCRMTEAINCCYARTAVRSIAQKLYMGMEGVKTLSTQSMAQLVVVYNALFENNPAMHLQNQKNSTIKKLLGLFNTHWKLQNRRDDFLNTFSIDEWNKLTQNQRAQHTIKKCKGCPMQHPLLSTAFPSKKHAQHQKKSISILPDISSSSTLGKTVFTQLNEIAHEYFGETATTVLASVPKSGLIQNPGRTERQRQMRSIVKKNA